MSTAIHVANYFIQLAAAEIEREFLTHLQIQKLLYYAQGWSLALRNKPMFDSPIKAWPHGPVTPDVYFHLKSWRGNPITADPGRLDVALLDSEDQYFTRTVWNQYKKFSAIKLRQKTHAERPWKETRPKNIISHETMKKFFETEDDVQFDSNQMPDWKTESDDEFLNAAQAMLVKHEETLRRLA